jgi:hypothetical protein
LSSRRIPRHGGPARGLEDADISLRFLFFFFSLSWCFLASFVSGREKRERGREKGTEEAELRAAVPSVSSFFWTTKVTKVAL